MTKPECRMTKEYNQFYGGHDAVRRFSGRGALRFPDLGRLRSIAPTFVRASPAYGAMRSVSVSVWKSVCSRNWYQGLSFFVVCATPVFSPVAKSSHEL